MSSSFYDFGRDLLFALPPEQAHNLAIKALSSGYGPRPDIPSDPRLTTTVAGLKFANPLGMAAGFDKNAKAVSGLFRLGFGAVEIVRSGYRHLLAEALDRTATFHKELDPSEVECLLQPMIQTS